MTAIIDSLLLPGGPLLLALTGLLLLRCRYRRWGYGLLWGNLLLLYACSLPLVANGLANTVQRYPPLSVDALTERMPQIDAIVLLAGDLYRDAPEYGGDSVGLLSLGRARYAARLARLTGAPILASGGASDADEGWPTEADLLGRLLAEEFGIRTVWLERDSRSTWDNARYSAAQLAERGYDEVLLVTHAVHMARAVYAFQRFGLTVIPAPTLFFPDRVEPLRLYSWLPSVSALWRNRYVLHELVGGVWYRLR